MKEVLTQLSMLTGALLAVLTIADWILLEHQKQRIRRLGDNVWLWLAEQKAGRFIQAFTAYRVQMAISISLWATGLIFTIIILLFNPNHAASGLAPYSRTMIAADFYMLVCLALVWWKVHPRVVAWIAASQTVRRYFWRCVAGCSVCLVMCAPLLFVDAALDRLEPFFSFFSSPILFKLFFMGVLLPFECAFTEAVLILIILVGSTIWTAIVWLLMAVIRVTQFILLRIVDHPKGPVLGLSGLLVGIAALAKAFL